MGETDTNSQRGGGKKAWQVAERNNGAKKNMKRCREAGNVPLHRPGHKQAIRGVFVLFIGRRHIYNK